MTLSSMRHSPKRLRSLYALLSRLRLRPAGTGQLQARRWFRPRLEVLEDRIAPTTGLLVGPNVNITKAPGNQAESTISINPTNPKNLFESDTLSTVGHYSTDGGQTWKVSDMSALPASIGDVQTAWDSFGNLFLVEIRLSDFSIMVARSSDGGATFKDVRIIAKSADSDQPSIAVGPSGVAGVAGAVWVSFTNSSNQLVADGAPVNGFDSVGAFQTPEIAPGPGGDFGSIAIGPNGQVLVNYQNNGSGVGPDTVKVNLDPDGLGPQPFNPVVIATSTNVGGFAPIPAQPSRTIDAESNLAWDRSGGAHNGRVYLVYVDRSSTSSPSTQVYVRYSDDSGTTWSSPVRVNDDPIDNGKSHFQPAIAVDESTGNVAVTWYDTRNSGPANNTTQVFGSVSLDGGATWLPNVQISTGTSNASAVDPGFDYGDYDLMDFSHGVFYRTWADNSNSTGDNPNGTGALDIYTAQVTIQDDLGLLLLDPTGSQSLMVTGNGSVTANGFGAVVVDSSDDRAAFLAGNATVTAEDIDVTGGVKTAGHGSFSGPVDQEAATPDPLGLALPPPPAPTFAAVHYSGSAPITLQPGTYVGGIAISGHGSVTLAPGVYYLQGGGFSITGQGTVSGSGVTIINAPAGPSDTILISGQGSLNLSAPTSGPFQGITIFQDPSSSNPIQFTDQASVTLAGVVYVPDAQVSIDGYANVTINAGPGTAVAPPILGALIAYDLKVDDNGVLTINPDDPASAPSPMRVLATPSSAGNGSVASAALSVPRSGGTDVAPSAAPAASLSGSVFDAAGLPLPQSLLLSGGQPVLGNNSSLAPASASAASTSSSHPAFLDPLFSGSLDGEAVPSGASKGVPPQRALMTSSASWNEQLVDELFSSLAEVA